MRPRRRRLVAPLILLALLTSGCGNDDDDDAVGDLPPAVEGDETPAPADEASPTPTPTPTPAEGSQVHEVEPGDTLWDLANRFGTTVDAIIEANDLEDPEAIFPGDELVIPAPQ